LGGWGEARGQGALWR